MESNKNENNLLILQSKFEQNEDMICAILENLQLGRLDDCIKQYSVLQETLMNISVELDSYPPENIDLYESIHSFSDEIARKDVLDNIKPSNERILPTTPIPHACDNCVHNHISDKDCRVILGHTDPSHKLTTEERAEYFKVFQVVSNRYYQQKQEEERNKQNPKRKYKRWEADEIHSLLLGMYCCGKEYSKLRHFVNHRTENQIRAFVAANISKDILNKISQGDFPPAPPNYKPNEKLFQLLQKRNMIHLLNGLNSSSDNKIAGNNSFNYPLDDTPEQDYLEDDDDDDDNDGGGGENNNENDNENESNSYGNHNMSNNNQNNKSKGHSLEITKNHQKEYDSYQLPSTTTYNIVSNHAIDLPPPDYSKNIVLPSLFQFAPAMQPLPEPSLGNFRDPLKEAIRNRLHDSLINSHHQSQHQSQYQRLYSNNNLKPEQSIDLSTNVPSLSGNFPSFPFHPNVTFQSTNITSPSIPFPSNICHPYTSMLNISAFGLPPSNIPNPWMTSLHQPINIIPNLKMVSNVADVLFPYKPRSSSVPFTKPTTSYGTNRISGNESKSAKRRIGGPYSISGRTPICNDVDGINILLYQQQLEMAIRQQQQQQQFMNTNNRILGYNYMNLESNDPLDISNSISHNTQTPSRNQQSMEDNSLRDSKHIDIDNRIKDTNTFQPNQTVYELSKRNQTGDRMSVSKENNPSNTVNIHDSTNNITKTNLSSLPQPSSSSSSSSIPPTVPSSIIPIVDHRANKSLLQSRTIRFADVHSDLKSKPKLSRKPLKLPLESQNLYTVPTLSDDRDSSHLTISALCNNQSQAESEKKTAPLKSSRKRKSVIVKSVTPVSITSSDTSQINVDETNIVDPSSNTKVKPKAKRTKKKFTAKVLNPTVVMTSPTEDNTSRLSFMEDFMTTSTTTHNFLGHSEDSNYHMLDGSGDVTLIAGLMNENSFM